MFERDTNQRLFPALGPAALTCAVLFTGCGGYEDSGGDNAMTPSGVEPTPTAAPTPAATPTAAPTPTATPTAAPTDGVPSATSPPTTPGEPAGPPPQATCENVTPCGGDVVGTWVATSSCINVTEPLDMTSLGLGCNLAPTTGSIEVTGTWTLNADGTIADATNTVGQQQVDLPAACLDVSGTVTSCDRIGAPMSGLGFESVECADDAATGGCSCPATINQMGGAALVSLRPLKNANYTVADNIITVTNGRETTQYAYCVSGSALLMSPLSATRVGTLTGSVVFQKQ